MKTSLRILVTVSLVAIGFQTFGQKFGVRVGGNLSNQFRRTSDVIYSKDNAFNYGFNFGMAVDLPFDKRDDMMSLEFGPYVSKMGCVENWDKLMFNGEISTKRKINLYYLHIPVALKLGTRVGDKRMTKLSVAAGAYGSLGWLGEAKITYESGDTEEQGVVWGKDAYSGIGNSESFFRRLDFGVLGYAGIEFDAIQFHAGYEYGIYNIDPERRNGMVVKNTNIFLSMTYIFWQNRRWR